MEGETERDGVFKESNMASASPPALPASAFSSVFLQKPCKKRTYSKGNPVLSLNSPGTVLGKWKTFCFLFFCFVLP